MRNCLIVDDSKIVRKVVRGIIEKFEFAPHEAEDGVFAYEFCEKLMPDLIMLDWNMPNMNGLEFLIKLRAMPGGDKPVVIFCTTETELSKIQEAIMQGANEYVMKPFDEEILRGKLSQVGMI